MYSIILPALSAMDPTITAPKCYYADDEAGVIIMENLKISGFDIADKTKGLKNICLKTFLREIFYRMRAIEATSSGQKQKLRQLKNFFFIKVWANQKQNWPFNGWRISTPPVTTSSTPTKEAWTHLGETFPYIHFSNIQSFIHKKYLLKEGFLLQNMNHDFWYNTSDQTMLFVVTLLLEAVDKAFVAIMEEHMGQTKPDLVKRVKGFKTKYGKKLQSLHKAKEGAFNCLIHNDAWTNNFMYRYDCH
jgi:hypothetical protein